MNSEHRDVVIKMYNGVDNEERFMCIELEEKAVDFMVLEDHHPTRFVLNVPTCAIKASSMEVHELERKSKVLTNGF